MPKIGAVPRFEGHMRRRTPIGPASLAESVENDLAAQTVNSAFLSFPCHPFHPTPTAADVVAYSSAETLRGTGDCYA
jgi:hypothetical protein